MKKKIVLLSLLFFFFLAEKSFSQQRFKVAVAAGTNFSQLDGDNFSGYTKFGINGGLRASAIFNERFQLDFEMLYSERGSRSVDIRGFVTQPHTFDINLAYAEIPVIATFHWKEVKRDKKRTKGRKRSFYRFSGHGGLSVGRVLDYQIEEEITLAPFSDMIRELITPFQLIESEFIKTDLSLSLGASVHFTKNIGFTARHAVSLTPLYAPSQNNDIGKTIRNFYITTLLFYEF